MTKGECASEAEWKKLFLALRMNRTFVIAIGQTDSLTTPEIKVDRVTSGLALSVDSVGSPLEGEAWT